MGIKSFQGTRQNIKETEKAPILVADYMTKSLITFSPEQSILEVMETFASHHISGGPVIDAHGVLVGIISEADCMKQISESRYFNLPILEKSVASFMTTSVETIGATDSIFDAAAIFHKNNRRRLPVKSEGKLVGQISRKDIVVAALKLSGQQWKK